MQPLLCSETKISLLTQWFEHQNTSGIVVCYPHHLSCGWRGWFEALGCFPHKLPEKERPTSLNRLLGVGLLKNPATASTKTNVTSVTNTWRMFKTRKPRETKTFLMYFANAQISGRFNWTFQSPWNWWAAPRSSLGTPPDDYAFQKELTLSVRIPFIQQSVLAWERWTLLTLSFKYFKMNYKLRKISIYLHIRVNYCFIVSLLPAALRPFKASQGKIRSPGTNKKKIMVESTQKSVIFT